MKKPPLCLRISKHRRKVNRDVVAPAIHKLQIRYFFDIQERFVTIINVVIGDLNSSYNLHFAPLLFGGAFVVALGTTTSKSFAF